MKPKTIVVTGTKGKSSIVFLLDYVLRFLGKKTLCINSEGLFEKGKLLKDNTFFLKKYKSSANVYGLKELEKIDLSKFDFLLLESSYANYKPLHEFAKKNPIDLSVLTNIYWDHIDGREVKNRNALINKKYSILNEVHSSGQAVIFTGDKKNSASHKTLARLHQERPELSILGYQKNKPLSISKTPTAFIEKGICYLDKEVLLNLKELSSPFKFRGVTADLNLLAVSVILKFFKIDPKKLYEIKNIFSLVPGRFNYFEKNGHKIILDYAHEQKSLELASKLVKKNFPDLKIKAVVRFSYYRKDEQIKNLIEKIHTIFDSFIVYDKALSRPALKDIFAKAYRRKAGDVGKMSVQEFKKFGAKVKKIDNEFEAIEKSIRSLKKDEVLYIIGDQIKKDLTVIKKALAKK